MFVCLALWLVCTITLGPSERWTLFFDMPHPIKLFFLIEMHITVIPLTIDTYHIVLCWIKIRTIRIDSPDTSRANSHIIYVFSKVERVSLTIRLVTEKHNLAKNYIRYTNFFVHPILTKENVQLIRFTFLHVFIIFNSSGEKIHLIYTTE